MRKSSYNLLLSYQIHHSNPTVEFVPYLFCSPFQMSDQVVDEGSDSSSSAFTPDVGVTPNDMEFASTESMNNCLKIIFNLALVHHSYVSASMKVYSLYRIAITILSALPIPSDTESLLLHVAILNNYGAWCFHYHDSSSMVMCFEEIKYIIDESCCGNDEYLMIDDTTKYGIYQNIRVLLNNTCSY